VNGDTFVAVIDADAASSMSNGGDDVRILKGCSFPEGIAETETELFKI
jgi:hypothetical protein